MRIVRLLLTAASVAALHAAPVAAQTIGAESVVDENVDGDGEVASEGRSGPRYSVQPYIEAQQVALYQIRPGDDFATYSVLAAGVDMTAATRRVQGGLSLRYERRIRWDDENIGDSDTLSGIGRAAIAVVPDTLQVEVGGLAARTRADGVSIPGQLDIGDRVSQVYSVYVGPTFQTRVDDVSVQASYRAGYSKVETPGVVVAPDASDPLDLFDESYTHQASARVGSAPGGVLPVGVGVGGSYYREDVSNLDQRVEDIRLRADVTVPVSPTLAVVAGAGYEQVEVSGRDVLRDDTGAPVIGADGRYQADPASPRLVAYDVEGVIYDVGVLWKPSRRTALQASIGKKYGSLSVTGSFSWQPSARTSINVAVYDQVTGFGGGLVNSLASLPTNFGVVRNPVTGELTGCVVGEGNANCVNAAFGNLRSAAYRARGVSASYNLDFGTAQTGIAAGYERRELIGADGTILEPIAGIVDENYFTTAYYNQRIDRRSGFSANAYLSIFDSGRPEVGLNGGVGAQASYYRELIDNLSATAAVGIDGAEFENTVDIWTASARLGLRYTF